MMPSNETKLRRAVLTNVIRECYPPSIQEDVFRRGVIPDAFGLEIDVGFSFGNSGVTTQRSALYSAVRQAFKKPDSEVFFLDDQGRKWFVDVTNLIAGEYAVFNGQQRMALPPLWMLLPNKRKRKSAFSKQVEKYNLSNEDKQRLSKLLDGPITDDQADVFLSVFNDTPSQSLNRVIDELRDGSGRLDSLVPQSKHYYCLLVGQYDDEVSLEKYVKDKIRPHFSSLHKWSKQNGFRFSLWCCSHASISLELNTRFLSQDQLVSVYKKLAENGDLVSQLGAIETGLLHLKTFPALRQYIVEMIKRIRADDPANKDGAFNMLASLITLVDGDFGRQKLFADAPPFWRRLAAISQASMLEQAVNLAGIKKSSFSNWAWDNRSQVFYFQTIADLRKEPRWMPDYVSPHQLKSEFIGRLLNLGNGLSEQINDPDLLKLITDFSSKEVKASADFPGPFLSGPLEGAQEMGNILPKEISDIIDSSLETEEISVKSLTALLNSACIYKLDKEQTGKTIELIKKARYHLKYDENASPYGLLNGLAIVAASTRSEDLANEIRVLVRYFIRNVSQADLKPREIFHALLIAAAACANFSDWCSYIGECMFEISMYDLCQDEAKHIHSHLHCLLSVEPGLWVTCSGAERALASLMMNAA